MWTEDLWRIVSLVFGVGREVYLDTHCKITSTEYSTVRRQIFDIKQLLLYKFDYVKKFMCGIHSVKMDKLTNIICLKVFG